MKAAPQVVAYCHCEDCRRWTGGPVGAFAAFSENDLKVEPPLGGPLSRSPGIERWSCKTCGSPLAAVFDYLPGQVYVPLGIIDQADKLEPEMHCHDDARLKWLKLGDSLPCFEGSGRKDLGSQQSNRNLLVEK